MIRRGYVRISTGQVHFRIAGKGSPVILLHDSFRCSTMHLSLIARLADSFMVIAPDTPGYGVSDPLNLGRRAEIDDFADALAETIHALGCAAPAVYGSHTSAKIALSCAARHSDAVGLLICDGLAVPASPLPDAYIAAYMKPFTITGDGGYIGENWTRMRDFRRFYPWFEPSAAHRMTVDQASLDADHIYALSLFSSGPNHVSAYGAALRYNPIPAVTRLSTTTVFMARADDVLVSFLDVLERHLPPSASVERLPADDHRWTERLRALFAAHAGAPATRPSPIPPAAFERMVIAMPHGDLETRRYGPAGPPTVLALHDAPGSAAALHAWCAALGADRAVIAPDLPGCNLSDPLPVPDARAYVGTLLDLLDHFGVEKIDVIAEGFSAPLALALAAEAPRRVSQLILDAALLAGDAEREHLARHYCPPITLSRQGGHMLDIWQRVRDMELQWPWYDESARAIRKIDPERDPDALHARMLAILRRKDHHGDACGAALSLDALDILRRIAVPITILTRTGDPRYPSADLLPPRTRRLETAASAGAAADTILKALAEPSPRSA